MRQIILNSQIFELSFKELPDDEKELILSARKAIKHSYSPYSKFKVGSSLKTKDGLMFSGSNQENASYSVTTCAERTLLSHASHIGHGADIRKIAVTAKSSEAGENYIGTKPISPCGVCRQAIKETEDRSGEPLIILMDCFNDDLIFKAVGIESLLPLAFGPTDLGII